jgi:hypothetical protein
MNRLQTLQAMSGLLFRVVEFPHYQNLFRAEDSELAARFTLVATCVRFDAIRFISARKAKSEIVVSLARFQYLIHCWF